MGGSARSCLDGLSELRMIPTEYDSLYKMLEAFHTEESCSAHIEMLRWPRGIICPLCGSSRKIYKVNAA